MQRSQQILYGGFAIQGDPINWAWSLRDLQKSKALSKAASDGAPPPKRLIERKESGYILWAFSDESDYKRLQEKIKECPKKAILVTTKYKDILPRGIIAIGEISAEDLISLDDDECMSWAYWPKKPKEKKKEEIKKEKKKEEEEKGWRYKFFIKIVDIATSIMESISKLEQLDDKKFEEKIEQEEILKSWASSVIPLVPGNLIQGSLAEISEEVLNEIYLIIRTKWRKSIGRVDIWDPKNVLQFLDNQKVMIPLHIVEKAVLALKTGKHLLLVGVPGSGKTTLARAIAQASGMDLMETTACSEWSRVDVIGGPVFIGGKVVWKCGALLTAIAKHYKAIEEGKCGVLLLIDEMNRANLDKSFGEFFTIFGSSDPDTWYIPESIILEMQEYHNNNEAIDEWGEYLIQLWRKEGKTGGLRIPSSFRIIGTINTYDRRYLFTLGQALLRRFAVVEIGGHSAEELKSSIDKLSEKIRDELSKAIGRHDQIDFEKIKQILVKLIELYKIIHIKAKLEFGLGLLIDIAKLAYALAKGNNDLDKAIDRAFSVTALPQFENLSTDKIKAIAEALTRMGFNESYVAIERFYPEIFIS